MLFAPAERIVHGRDELGDRYRVVTVRIDVGAFAERHRAERHVDPGDELVYRHPSIVVAVAGARADLCPGAVLAPRRKAEQSQHQSPNDRR
jgi:hypothetical protein